MAKASSSGWSSVLAGGADTIVARGSGPGRGALAVVRVSGADTCRIATVVCPGVDFQLPWTARLTDFFDAGGSQLERGVAIPYRAPQSYTGEDMLEALVHGSTYLVNALIDALIAAGARPAEPGEFTRRAVANGKMDLVQAEAVRDLIAADTARQADNARHQLAGRLSEEFAALRDQFLGVLADVEGTVDFAEHGVDWQPERCLRRVDECRRQIAALLDTAVSGERIRQGVRVVIVGPPNSGKSTLFNRLIGVERAIVTPHPGTTRDVVEAELDIGGLRVVLADTAGLRDTSDPVESEGVRRTRAAVSSAHVVVQLWPADTPQDGVPVAPIDDLPTVRVWSKADLAEAGDSLHPPNGWQAVSCVTGDGLVGLRERLRAAVESDVVDLAGGVAISARHRRALQRAATELARADHLQPELLAESVRWALREVQEVTGEVAGEEVLDEVFRTFCIGK